MVQKIFRCGCVALCLFFSVGICWGKDVGQVISYKAGVLAERGGQSVPLALKSPVADTDALITDATGKAQILFEDDTTVTLSPNTKLRLDSVVSEGKTPVFKAHMGQGMARFITGKIVEKNPAGFTVVTPEATVGIRGTIFVVQVGNGQTTVYVLNTTKQVYVNGILVPTSFKITLPQGSLAPMNPEDMSRVSANLAARDPDAPLGRPLASTPPAQPAFVPTNLAEAPLSAQVLAETLTPPAPIPPAPLTNAIVAGSLNGLTGVNGTFNFAVNLGSGAVSSGVMNHLSFGALTGGSGSISGGSLSVTGFSNGTLTGVMAGSSVSGPSGLDVSGTYSILSAPSVQDSGTFSGQQQP